MKWENGIVLLLLLLLSSKSFTSQNETLSPSFRLKDSQCFIIDWIKFPELSNKVNWNKTYSNTHLIRTKDNN